MAQGEGDPSASFIQAKQKEQKKITHPPKAPKIKSKKNWKHIIHPQIQKPRKKKKKKKS
jgi:hypothetical protein